MLAERGAALGVVMHFSEDAAITRFIPHVPPTNPDTPPMVWAIDEEHAPLYWFPRDCPRVTFWTDDGSAAVALGPTTAARVHAIEIAWLDRVRACSLFVYALDRKPFEPWPDAYGHWVAKEEVTPLSVEPVGDLLRRHAEALIELRIVPSLQPLVEPVVRSGHRFSIVRMANATDPREG